MEPYNYWSPPNKRRGGCVPLSAGVLVLGVVGVALGLAALTAYAVLQAPTLRSSFGEYFYETTAEDIDNAHRLQYSSEIIVVVVTGVLGILSNCLLIYGVVSSRRWFLVHWLVYHVVIVAAALVATILILLLQTGLHKLYSLIPIAVIVTLVLCWVKVYQLFCEIEIQVKPPRPCQLHSNEHFNLPPPDFGWGRGYANEWAANKADMFEFYPTDKLSWQLQDRTFDGSWRDPWSHDRHMENTMYCDSETTVSSIVPNNNNNNNTEYDYTTLPVGGKGHSDSNKERRSSDDTTESGNNVKPTNAGIPGARLNGITGSFALSGEYRPHPHFEGHPQPGPRHLEGHHIQHGGPPHFDQHGRPQLYDEHHEFLHFNPPPGRHFMDMGLYHHSRTENLPRASSYPRRTNIGRPGHYENKDMKDQWSKSSDRRPAFHPPIDHQERRSAFPPVPEQVEKRGFDNPAFSGEEKTKVLSTNRNSEESRTDSNLTNAEI